MAPRIWDRIKAAGATAQKMGLNAPKGQPVRMKSKRNSALHPERNLKNPVHSKGYSRPKI